MSSWIKDALDLATPVLTLAAIGGLGYKIGEHFGKISVQRTADKDVREANILLSAARKTEAAQREEASKWRSKYEELSPHIGDRGAAEKLDRIRSLVERPGSVWFDTPLSFPAIRSVSAGGRAVITVANLKGGVGKTTISTHLAAALAEHKTVLFVDLDFQGSGSTFLLRDAQREDIVQMGERARSSWLLEPGRDLSVMTDAAIPLGGRTPNLSVVPSYYPLADAEERLMFRWVLGDEPQDIRYALRRLLHADGMPWDVVVIDAPPRLSTAMAEALCASTHLLIPTQYEPKSVEAALYFVQTLQEMRSNGVCPQLNILGILPSVVPRDSEIRHSEVKYLQDKVVPLIGGNDALWVDVAVPQRAAFRRPNLVHRDSDPGAKEAWEAIQALAGKVRMRVWNGPQ
jgi:cellulose biosynthesis protein BcsQ